MPKLDFNSLGSEKRKGLDLPIGGPSGDGAAFKPFTANPPPPPKPRFQTRTIRDVLPDNTR